MKAIEKVQAYLIVELHFDHFKSADNDDERKIR